ncbi:MAG: HNH endonuclease signature motif containing protein [Thermoplasmata archaeon]
MKTKKLCPHCYQIKPIDSFVDTSGVKNPRGKFCSQCREEREFILTDLKDEQLIISKLKIMYGEEWENYAYPHYFPTTLFLERDFCPYCGTKLTKENSQIDHMDPLELGGKNSIKNAVVCCKNCNAKKGAKSFLSWVEQIKPEYKKISIDIYIVKHGYPPEEFKQSSPTTRTKSGDIDYELLLDEDESK